MRQNMSFGAEIDHHLKKLQKLYKLFFKKTVKYSIDNFYITYCFIVYILIVQKNIFNVKKHLICRKCRL